LTTEKQEIERNFTTQSAINYFKVMGELHASDDIIHPALALEFIEKNCFENLDLNNLKKLVFAKSRVKELAYKDFSNLLKLEIDKHIDNDLTKLSTGQLSRFMADLCMARYEKAEIFKKLVNIFSQIKFEKEEWGYLITVLKAHCIQKIPIDK